MFSKLKYDVKRGIPNSETEQMIMIENGSGQIKGEDIEGFIEICHHILVGVSTEKKYLIKLNTIFFYYFLQLV
ncbi:hypothetical protein HZS_4658 [Henneguya salminicola]|nr:hypothetical protein HZS_4658 [Henneguya salminicola]